MSKISLLGRFPLELIEEVVDAIPPDDVDGLKALSTVAQSLRYLCHKRLFDTVTISTAIPKGAKEGSKSLASKFLDVLEDSPYLALYTTRLDITIHENLSDDDNLISQQAIQKVLAEYIKYNSPTPKLRKFGLRQGTPSDLGVYAPEIRKEVVNILEMKSLVHVELKDVPIDIIHHLSPSVRHLALWNPTLEDDERKRGPQWQTDLKSTTTGPQISAGPGQLPPGPRLKIESLLVDDAVLTQCSENRNALALKWLLHQQDKLDFTGLKRLRVGLTTCNALESHGAVAELLRLCADSLEEWSFTPALAALANKVKGQYDDPVTLANLPSLKYLHLGVQTGFWTPTDSDVDGTIVTYEPMIWIYSLLSSIPLSESTAKLKGKNNNDKSNTNTNKNKDKDKDNIKTLVLSSSFGMMPTANTSPSNPSTMTAGYFGPSFENYLLLAVFLGYKLPCLERLNFEIEEAPYYKEYMKFPHTFSVRAKWIEQNIKENMTACAHRKKMKISSNPFPYSKGLLLDNDWK